MITNLVLLVADQHTFTTLDDGVYYLMKMLIFK